MRKKVTHCPAETTITLIGGRWKVLILWILFKGTYRLSDLKRHIENSVEEQGITQRILIHQLREMEADGLIHREVYKQVPPRVDYSLTSLGKSLKPVIDCLIQWGKKYPSDQDKR